MHLQPPHLLILLLLSDSLLSFQQPKQKSFRISLFHTIRKAQISKHHEHESAVKIGAYPSEVIHVGGLNWSADEGQVVNFCCLLTSLV